MNINRTNEENYSRLSARGKKGAEARHNISEAEESRIAKKAAETRMKENPNTFREMGKKGAAARHNISEQAESEIAKKAAATRKMQDPDVFSKMGRKGGESSKAKRKNAKQKQPIENEIQ